jgi:hypothetical protein
MLAEQDAAAGMHIGEPVPLGNGSLEEHPATNGTEAAEQVAEGHEPAADQVPAAAAVAVAGEEAAEAGPSHDQQQPDADAAADAAGEGTGGEEPRKRRHKWGPPAGGEFAEGEGGDGPKKKKRKSRWETSDELVVVPAKGSGAIIIPGNIPKEVTICGGIKVGGAGGLHGTACVCMEDSWALQHLGHPPMIVAGCCAHQRHDHGWHAWHLC